MKDKEYRNYLRVSLLFLILFLVISIAQHFIAPVRSYLTLDQTILQQIPEKESYQSCEEIKINNIVDLGNKKIYFLDLDCQCDHPEVIFFDQQSFYKKELLSKNKIVFEFDPMRLVQRFTIVCKNDSSN